MRTFPTLDFPPSLTRQAQVAINTWLRQYNQIRPHHALNMRPPAPETLLEKPKINGRI
ncbi:MAG: integrase core domain-containing protein [Paracoccaceae bacterium]